jgi:plasmid stabilization system protein ParE
MIYRLTRKEKSDIKAIYRYTVEYFEEGQAQEYLEGLEYSFGLLTDNPNMGRLSDENTRRYVY